MTLLKNASFLREVTLPPSKSEAQRYLICAAFADRPTDIILTDGLLCDDTAACVSCLRALGASVEINGNVLSVVPCTLPPDSVKKHVLDFGESGTSLRLLLPLTAALGIKAEAVTRGSLRGRPLSGLLSSIGEIGKTDALTADGSVSSQYVSGLLYALCFTGGTLTVTGNPVSRPYIDMTVSVLRRFGAVIRREGYSFFTVEKMPSFISPGAVSVSGDWSAAAYPLCAGLIGKTPVTVKGADEDSPQGDRIVTGILRSFGGRISRTEEGLTAFPSRLRSPGTLDMMPCPDLVPAVAVCAALAEGRTVITGIGHLRYKESDRIDSLCALISAVGGKISCLPLPDGPALLIDGPCTPVSAEVSSRGDHRIALAAVLLSAVCGELAVDDTGCISKSWPGFERALVRGPSDGPGQ